MSAEMSLPQFVSKTFIRIFFCVPGSNAQKLFPQPAPRKREKYNQDFSIANWTNNEFA